MAVETELKLSIAPSQVARLQRHPVVKALTRGKPSVRLLRTVYYDTPDGDLRRSGVSLRVRRAGRGFVQTVKCGGRVAAGLHQRSEFESPIAHPAPDFTKLTEPAVAELFASSKLRAALKPAFATEFTRVTRLLDTPAGGCIEFCLDRGRIAAGARRETISEIELELRSGDVQQLFELARTLGAELDLRLDSRSKAARGYALLEGRGGPQKSAAPALTMEMSAAQAFVEIAGLCVTHMQANERGFLRGGDIEYLHQMRIGVRRLRSALALFAALPPPEPAQSIVPELQWLGQALGAARDWDVLVTETLPPIAAQFPEHPGLAELASAAAKPRQAANRMARRALASRRYQELLLALGALLAGRPNTVAADPPLEPGEQPLAAEQRAVQHAEAVLVRTHLRVIKRGRHLTRLDAVRLHRLRIAVKKLRYAADFFSPLYPRKRVKSYLQRLAGLQQVLGAINDAATARRLLVPLDAGAAERREAAGIILGWAACDTARLRQTLKREWRAFKRVKTFW